MMCDYNEEYHKREVQVGHSKKYRYTVIIPEGVDSIVDIYDFAPSKFPSVGLVDIDLEIHNEDYGDHVFLTLVHETDEKLDNHKQFHDTYTEQMEEKKKREARTQRIRDESLNSTLADDILEGKLNPSISILSRKDNS